MSRGSFGNHHTSWNLEVLRIYRCKDPVCVVVHDDSDSFLRKSDCKSKLISDHTRESPRAQERVDAIDQGTGGVQQE